MSKLMAKVKASISLVPTGSHVVILSLIGILALCLGCAFIFIWYSVDYWPPLISAGILFAAVVLFWLRSHRHVDDRFVPPVEMSMTDGTNSTTLSMHPRGLPAGQQLKLIERAMSAMQHRKPLPEPDGLVDEKGIPIPLSQEEARQRVEAANNEVRDATGAMESHLNASEQQNEIAQHRLTVEPDLEEIKEINKPSSD